MGGDSHAVDVEKTDMVVAEPLRHRRVEKVCIHVTLMDDMKFAALLLVSRLLPDGEGEHSICCPYVHTLSCIYDLR